MIELMKSTDSRSPFKSKKIFQLSKITLVFLFIFALMTSWIDDIGVMKHIWTAAFGAVTVFEVYRRIILPKMISQMVTSSNFRANTYMIVFTYILSCTSGPGLLTAVLNITGLSATILLINPFLPKLYYPMLFAFGSVAFIVIAVTFVLHPVISVPIAVILAFFSALFFRKIIKLTEIENMEEDVECTSLLQGQKISIFDIKGIFVTISSLLLTGLIGFVGFYWIILSINPFWMRAERISKYETLHRFPHDVNLRVREVSSLDDLRFYKSSLNKFPVVIKPSICTTNSRNVHMCPDYNCLKNYLNERINYGPLNDGKNGNLGSWVIQEYVEKTEGVAFYYKFPYMSKGSVKNIGIRDKSKEYTKASGTSLEAEYFPKHFQKNINSSFLKFFDDLAAKIPGFNGGRFDIMLPDSDFKDPRGVNVLELNVFFLGCIEEKKLTSIWDEIKRLRTSLMQIYIGIVNIVAGYNFLNFWGIIAKVPELISRSIQCGNHEHLFAKP